MTYTHRLRIAVGTTVTATALTFVAGAAFAAPAAQANELCYGAGVTGTITGTHGVGPVCTYTGLAVLCAGPNAGLDPTIGVWAEACVPV